MTRGVVLPLTPAQVVTRALYLAGEVGAAALDRYVRSPTAQCPSIYYLLDQGKNGGADPTAPDPASRWTFQDKHGNDLTAVTCDCSGGSAWMGGYDRCQPERLHGTKEVDEYDGYLNTNSKILDARGKQSCFVPLERPELGAVIVCPSGSPGHKVGHEGVIVSVPAEWDPRRIECWAAIGVVDVASRTPARANRRSTGRGWYVARAKAMFLRSIMKP